MEKLTPQDLDTRLVRQNKRGMREGKRLVGSVCSITMGALSFPALVLSWRGKHGGEDWHIPTPSLSPSYHLSIHSSIYPAISPSFTWLPPRLPHSSGPTGYVPLPDCLVRGLNNSKKKLVMFHVESKTGESSFFLSFLYFFLSPPSPVSLSFHLTSFFFVWFFGVEFFFHVFLCFLFFDIPLVFCVYKFRYDLCYLLKRFVAAIRRGEERSIGIVLFFDVFTFVFSSYCTWREKKRWFICDIFP